MKVRAIPSDAGRGPGPGGHRHRRPLIGEHAAHLRQEGGRRWSGLCPFHAEKTPSFSVNAEEGFYYCFGCQASGDAISFVRAMEHLDFVDAVRFLADRAGVTLHEDQGPGRDHQRRSELLDAMERAVAWYHERLLSAPDAGPARDYLRSRGYDGDVVRQFRLGWAPDDWDALAKALGLSEKVLSDRARASSTAGAGPRTSSGPGSSSPSATPRGGRSPSAGASCRRARARRRPERPEPKYKNSQESPIYSKRRTLYALNWAKQGIIAQGEVVVCEGYTDVIGCFQAGVPWAVATCGTALGRGALHAAAQLRQAHRAGLRRRQRPDRRRPHGSTSGSASTRSTWWWPTCPAAATRATWPATDPEALAEAVADGAAVPPVPGGPDAPGRATSPRPRGGPGRPRRRWRRWPSTPTTWCVTST